MKGERDQTESLNTVAVKTALEEKHYPYDVTHQGGVRDENDRLATQTHKGHILCLLSEQTMVIYPHSPLELPEWGFVMTWLTQRHHCLGK